MKTVYYVLSSFFIIGSMILLIFMFNPPNKPFSNEAHADWPDLNFEELYKGADLIAVVQTDNLKRENMQVQLNNETDTFEAQFSELKVNKALKGETISKTITLNQAIDYVDENTKYLMFLTKGEDGYYYELTDTSILEFEDKTFTSNITDFTGDHSLTQIEEKISSID